MNSARPRLPLLALAAALGLAAIARPRVARADETDACIDASVKGQELRDAGKLQSAREKFLLCSREACPGLVRADCATWLANVDARIPSVVVSARDADGRDVAEVQVTLDQRPLLPRLDGKAISLDPGEHLFRFERSGSPPVEEKLVAREGEQRRVLAVRFQRAPRPLAPPPPSSPGVPAAVWILGGVGIGLGGAFAALGATAKIDRDHLRATCAPRCPVSDVNSIRTREIFANVALGAGVVSVGAAVVVLLARPAAPRPPPLPAALDVAPTPGGAVAILRGRFSL